MHSLKCKRLAVLCCEQLSSCDSGESDYTLASAVDKNIPFNPFERSLAISDFYFLMYFLFENEQAVKGGGLNPVTPPHPFCSVWVCVCVCPSQ